MIIFISLLYTNNRSRKGLLKQRKELLITAIVGKSLKVKDVPIFAF